ncbi:MAG: glycosyl hydrolase [Akkermansiaceae bacterium]
MRKYTLPLIITSMLTSVNVGVAQTETSAKKPSKPPVSVRAADVKTVKKPFQSKKGICITLRTPGKDKKGKVVKGDYLKNMPKVQKLNLGWNYSWGIKLQPGQPESTSYGPMVYSVYGNPDVSTVAGNIQKSISSTVERQKHTVLFGYNEPDRDNQGNLSVEKALKYWKSLESLDVLLCSPSTVHPDNDWMKQFMKGVEKQGLRVNYIGVHDYGNGNAEAFKSKLRRIHKMYGNRPIIVTEFAVADWSAPSKEKNRHSKEKVLKYMQEVLPWMDQQDWIAGYAWFPFGENTKQGTSSALFDEKGELTKLGRFYTNHKSK